MPENKITHISLFSGIQSAESISLQRERNLRRSSRWSRTGPVYGY